MESPTSELSKANEAKISETRMRLRGNMLDRMLEFARPIFPRNRLIVLFMIVGLVIATVMAQAAPAFADGHPPDEHDPVLSGHFDSGSHDDFHLRA